MARTVLTLKSQASQEDIIHYISTELHKLGFSDRSTVNERIWGKYDGIMTKGQRISVSFNGGNVYLSAWLDDVMLGEWDLEGALARPVKNKVRKILNQLANGITSLPASKHQSNIAAAPSAASKAHTKSTGVKYCTNCGSAYNIGTKFCSNCGNKLS